MGRAARAGALTAAAAFATPAAAQAHGLGGSPGSRVPGFVFGWGAAIVLVITFLALREMWATPRLHARPPRLLFRAPGLFAALDIACGAIGIALFVLVVYAAAAGSTNPVDNFAPAFIYIAMWVAPVVLSLLIGDVFAAFSPWRAIARAAGRLAGGRLAPARPYPQRLGVWPAVAGLVAFAWLELVCVQRDHPRLLAVLAVGYLVVQLAGIARYGEAAWTRNGDAFGVVFARYAGMSALERRDGALWRRVPLAGLTALPVVAGTVALYVVMIGATAFDGLSSTQEWRDALPHLTRFVGHLGLGPSATAEIIGTAGLALSLLVVAAVYRLGVDGAAGVDGGRSRAEIARTFAVSLVPIAAGYVVAHYLTYLLFQGQTLFALASDPLGRGSDLFGTADTRVHQFLGRAVVWYLQVGALVLGHIGGIVLAHDRALVIYGDAARAARTQQWMLTAMVGFTGVGLWLLASVK